MKEAQSSPGTTFPLKLGSEKMSTTSTMLINYFPENYTACQNN
jgi:hypothetical protein